MRDLTSAELARMQGAQADSLQDTCIVYLHSSGAKNALGHATQAYTATTAQACGYKPSTTREANEGGEVVLVDAVLRLGIGANIASTSRVKVTHRFGAELSDKPLFSVIGQPQRGPSGLVINLQRVTDE